MAQRPPMLKPVPELALQSFPPGPIWGTDRDDVLHGSESNDWILGNGGNDRINGYGGNDRIWGGSGNDVIYGGGGQDRIKGGAGNDWIDGGADNDLIEGGGGNDYLWGSAGHDTIHGEDGNDWMWGGDGSDWIFGADGDDRIWGGDGNDWITGSYGDDWLYGGAGNDVIGCGQGTDRVDGGAGSDVYVVVADDVFTPDTFNDTGTGAADYDIIKAGNHHAKIQMMHFDSSNGIEEISDNGFSNLSIFGGGADITFDFSSTVLSGDITIRTGWGNDTIIGSLADDTIDGGNGNDLIEGGAGNDHIDGGNGYDRLYGGDGDDILVSDGAGTLYGGAGNDILQISKDYTHRRHVDGGVGDDVLKLTGHARNFDLDRLDIFGIEAVDLTGGGNDRVTLNVLDVLNASDTSNTLKILGNPGDAVVTEDGWTAAGQQTDGGVLFDVYTSGVGVDQATLMVESELDTSGVVIV